ncbi:polysaccharide lyase [Gloeobacter violaceus]|uniref:Gll4265 protein n=1 Tax=Gloeobacter violaceus (strain ATCC 29082 / PCC 7421) TaxID=251221 RepID=Q7NDH0_GLOVI|nr:polysaccharide lyase [Gloeobacter violaceus]BAC92206.1 gll4265 [Gloeobacter violaceus PCC 7421]
MRRYLALKLLPVCGSCCLLISPQTALGVELAAAPPAPQAAESSNVYFVGDFESGDLTGFDTEICCSDAVLVISAPKKVGTTVPPVRAGRYAAQFNLRKSDPDVSSSRRAELRLGTVKADSSRWYAFSVYLPVDWETDEDSYDIIAQWHDSPDFDLGETWRSPALNLQVAAGNWKINRRWDPNPVTYDNTPGPGGGTESIGLGPYSKGVWTDWVLHVNWSYEDNGVLEVWKNGVLVLAREGPNTYNDQTGPYLKLGIYKPDWKYDPAESTTSSRTLYIDEVRIGNSKATYEEVSP